MSPRTLSFREKIRDNFVFSLTDVAFDKNGAAFDIVDGAAELVPLSLFLEECVEISPFSHDFLYELDEENFDCGGNNGEFRVAALIGSVSACV